MNSARHTTASTPADPGHELPTSGLRLKRVGLTCVMAIATLNIWTGGPLLAVWVGSRVQGSGPPSMAAIGVVAVTLGVVSYALVKLLARLDALYARVAGRPSGVSRHVPWLRSMRGERPHQQKHARELSPLEIILIASVVLVVALFEIWFFFYSPSPIDQRSGRSHKTPLIGAVTTRDASRATIDARASTNDPRALRRPGALPPANIRR